MFLYYKVGFLIFLLFLDGVTKFYAQTGEISFNFANVIVSKFSLNPGISFNLFANFKYLVIFFQVIILLIAIKLFKLSFKKDYGFWLVICGGVGNIIFRFLPGVNLNVVDFVSVKNLFICNLADIYISLGVVYLLVSSLKRKSPIRGFF